MKHYPKGFWIIDNYTSQEYNSFKTFETGKGKIDSNVLASLYSEYNAINQSPCRIQYDLGYLNDSVNMDIDTSFIKKQFRTRYHEFYKIRERYPSFKGIIYCTRIAYFKDYALAYVGYVMGQLDGGGAIYILKKSDQRWQIVDSERLWIS